MYSYFFKVSKEINKVFQVGNSLRVKQETSLLKNARKHGSWGK